MTTIKDKIRQGIYASQNHALAAIVRSKHTAAEKKALRSMVQSAYAKKDRLDATASVGTVVPASIDHASTYLLPPLGPMTHDLEKEMMRIALRMMVLMAHHKLSREEILDRLKETLIIGVG